MATPTYYTKEYHGNDIIELNVGGVLYATRYATLALSKSPYFEAAFKITTRGTIVETVGTVFRDKNGRLFIDRDGDLFRYVMQFMRDGAHVVLPEDTTYLKMLRREAQFFGLLKMINIVENILRSRGIQFSMTNSCTNPNSALVTPRMTPRNTPKVGRRLVQQPQINNVLL